MRGFLRRGLLRRTVQAAAGSSIVMRGLGQSSNSEGAGVAGIDHVALPMRNTEAMMQFYRALGMDVREGSRICSVHCGDQKINFHRPSLWQDESFTLRAPKVEPPCGDICFVWQGSATALSARLDLAGAQVIEGPVERQGGRSGGEDRGTSLYVRDPDANLVEFIIY